MNFRTDINGLRAIAVALVVIFHFDESLLRGGFVGVDIFFVISGFLMTAIILTRLEKGTLSIWQFYLARANRILPALIFLCFAWLIIGYLFFTPIDLKSLAEDSIASILFLSNFSYWKTSGYFAAAANEKLLLHTWSLSVEWQFYIIYPVILAVTHRFLGFSLTKMALLIGFFISLGLSVKFSDSHSVASYFLLPTRAWEMLLGGLAFVYPVKINEKFKKVLHFGGLAIIVISSFLISSEIAWPGYIALFPCVATFLVLLSNFENSFITNNFAIQKLGKWSYSIYLWHWPIVTLGYYYSLNNWFVIGIILSLIFGALSYHFIERFSFNSNLPLRMFYRARPLLMGVPVIVFSVFIVDSDGALDRFDGRDRQLYLQAIDAIGDFDYPDSNLKLKGREFRFIKGASDENILFIGASHIEQTYPYVNSFSKYFNVYYLTKGGCFLTPSMDNPKWSCENIQNYKEIFDELEFQRVVTSLYCFDCYLPLDKKDKDEEISKRIEEFSSVLQFLASRTNYVYLLTDDPRHSNFNPRKAIRMDAIEGVPVDSIVSSFSIHQMALSKLRIPKNVVLISPLEHICTDVCNYVSNDGRFRYKDSNHARPWFSKEAMTYLQPALSPNNLSFEN